MLLPRLVASVTLLCLAHAVLAQSSQIPMDAAGRPLKDDRNKPLLYDTAPRVSLQLAAPARATSTPFKTKASRKGTRAQKTNIRLQKTGTSPSYDVLWRTSSFGTGIGATGIWPMDTNADGDVEIILAGGSGFAGNAYWSIVDYDSQAAKYQIAWQSAPYYDIGGSWTPSISALRAIEFGTTKRVWVGRSDGAIDVIDALTRELVQTISVSADSIDDFAIGDADNDGDIDVVALTSREMHLFNPTSLEPSGVIAYGGNRLALGNIDDDEQIEVVLNTGMVLEAESSDVTIEWQSPTPFGSYVGLADIDADGREELVAAEGWYVIRAWDLEADSLKWSHQTGLDIGTLRLLDVTGDDVPEIIYGDNQWGSIHALDGATHSELWSIGNPEHGTTDVAVFDSDGDGELEIMWGSGWSSTGPDYLFVHDVATQEREWQSADYSGPYEAVDIGDLDADGTLEIIVASYQSQSGYADGLVMVFDAQTHDLEWTTEHNTFGMNAWTGVHALKVLNVDSDPQLEIVVGTDRLYDGALYVIDSQTHGLQNDAIYDSGSPLSVLDAADLTGDGQPEIIVGNEVAHTGSPGVFIYVLDPRSDAVVWKSAALSTGFSSVSDIEVVDVGDYGADVLAVSNTIHLVRWSDRQHLTSTATNYWAATAGDVHSASGNEVLAATTSGSVDVLRGDTLAVLTTYPVCNSTISAIKMHAANRIVVTCEDSLLVYDLATQSIVDETPAPVTLLGTNGSLVRTVDGDRSLILTGGSEATLFVDLSSNAIPTVDASSASVHWRGSIELQLSGNDADGDELRFEIASLPALGAVTWLDAAQGRLRYSASGTHVGSDTFQVRVSDGAQFSASRAVSLTLTNDAPTAQTTALTLHWRGAQTVAIAGADADNDPLSFAIIADPTHGSATLDPNSGELTFEPTGAFVGTDTLSYRVTDGAAFVSTELQITLSNTAPVAAAAEYNITPGTNINARLRATDADEDPLAFEIVGTATKGTITYEADTGLFEYVPSTGAIGTDRVTFKVSDGVSESEATLTFNHPAVAPPATGTPGRTGGGGGGGNFGGLLLLLLLPLLGRHKAERE